MIKTTTVENYDNAVYNTPGGDDTKDKVFLLSQLEVIESDYGFADTYDEYDVKRRCAPSGYAIARGTWVDTFFDNDYKTADGLGTGSWWLRSPGGDADIACLVYDNGNVNSYGHYVYSDDRDGHGVGVRPALVLNLKS